MTTPKMILVVEPHQSVRRMLERVLRSAGYETLVASDATSAFELLRDHPETVSLLVAAGTVSSMSGVELAEYATQL
ncbi:MAG TPA: hypothetical protein VM715_05920, partial [Candidatus Acidoferrum sp.]|nr:hypothetical protein [Candidatus Acidoferrum sp.]